MLCSCVAVAVAFCGNGDDDDDDYIDCDDVAEDASTCVVFTSTVNTVLSLQLRGFTAYTKVFITW